MIYLAEEMYKKYPNLNNIIKEKELLQVANFSKMDSGILKKMLLTSKEVTLNYSYNNLNLYGNSTRVAEEWSMNFIRDFYEKNDGLCLGEYLNFFLDDENNQHEATRVICTASVLIFYFEINDKLYNMWKDINVPKIRPYINKVSTKKEGCFITTATCQALNKPDNCYELTKFREYRDNWLINQLDGEKIIQKYYEIAPNIVYNINKSKDKYKIYQEIWNKSLKKCLGLIELKKYEECKETYIKMVEELELKFKRKL